MKRIFLAPLMRYLTRLSHPRLFMIFAGLFVLDTLTPDFIPFVDEILLGLATMIFANWKKSRVPGDSKDTTIEGTSTRR